MSVKTKRVPATTNNITLGIVNFLNNRGHFAFRANTTGVWDQAGGFFRTVSKEARGCPDVLACMTWQLSKDTKRHGDFYGFEIKNESTKDRLSSWQLEFHAKVKAAGGIVIVVHSYDEFLEWYWASQFGNPF